MSIRMVGIIQARMGSSRLPGKVLRPLCGRSVLAWVVRAAEESGALDDLVVATTTLAEDEAIVAECERLGVGWHRGPAEDVLTRFVGALRTHPAEAVMRFTADCPLLDPAVLGTVGSAFRAIPELDYLSTALPRRLPRGLDAEVVGAAALGRADALATGHHRVHVTSYVYSHPADFSVLGLSHTPPAPELRVTLDTAEDWALIQAVAGKFGDTPVPHRALIEWLELNPAVRALNDGVRQKELAEA